MAVEIAVSQVPWRVLSEVGAFLASDPVRHNLILTLLHARVAHPEPGRYRAAIWEPVEGVVRVRYPSRDEISTGPDSRR